MLNKQDLFDSLICQKFKDQSKAKHYINRYVNFITQRLDRDLVYQATRNNTEKHHIIPRSWGGSDDSSNLIVLTVKEHIVAHHILARTTNRSMIFAFNRTVNRSVSDFNYNISLKIVEEARKEWLNLICKPVINLNTGEIYSGASNASRELGYSTGSICGACLKHTRIGGHYWEYLCNMSSIDEKARMDRIQQYQTNLKSIKRKHYDDRKKPVIELDTGKVYDGAIDAANAYNTRRTYITKSARMHAKHAGHYWAYVDEFPDYTIEKGLAFCKRQDDKIRETRDNVSLEKSYEIINLMTKQIFQNASDAAEKLNLSVVTIRQSARRQTKGYGEYWIYTKDLDDLSEESINDKLNELKERDELHKLIQSQNERRGHHGRKLINLQTREIAFNRQELSRKYGISADRVNYAAINHKKLLGKYCWQYIDQLDNIEDETLNQELSKYTDKYVR